MIVKPHYRPGKNKPSVFEFVNTRHREVTYLQKVKNLLLDEEETTAAESSDEDFERFDIPAPPESKHKEEEAKNLVTRFNGFGEGKEHLALVEYHGFHYNKDFPHEKWAEIKEEKFNPQTIYSLAAIDPKFKFQEAEEAEDSGNESEVEESGSELEDEETADESEYEDVQSESNDAKKALATCDKRVQILREKWQETKLAKDDPSKYKTNRGFDNLSYRMLQEYIMAFRRLVIDGEIQKVYVFPSALNPFLSTTCNAGKAMLYGSGIRHSKITQIWRDPHYRRSTGKPKHPVIGYVDVYVLDIDYARRNTYCRDRMMNLKQISLSKMYQNGKGERIFIAEIPQRFHYHRFFVVFPDCSQDFSVKSN